MRNRYLLAACTIGLMLVNFGSLAQRKVDARYSDELLPLLQVCHLPTDWSEASYTAALEAVQLAAMKLRENGERSRASGCLRVAAQLADRLNKTSAAEEMVMNSLRTERSLNNRGGEVEALSYLIITTAKDGRLRKSIEYKDRIGDLENLVDLRVEAYANFAFAEYYYRKDRNLALMIGHQEKALSLYREAGDKAGEALTLTELAYSYVMNNERGKGRLSAEEAVRISRSNADPRSLAFGLIALGDAHQRVGEWQQAFECFKEAERYFPVNVDLLESAILFDRLGVYYQSHADLAKANDYYQKALDQFRKINNLFGVSELLTVLGQISVLNSDYENGLRYFNEGLAVSKKSGDAYSAAFARENIGDTYFRLNNDSKALLNFAAALKGFKKVGIDHAIASVHQRLGLLFHRQGRAELSGKHLESALKINLRILSKEGQASALFNLAKVDRLQGEVDSALAKINESVRLTEYLQNNTDNSKLRSGYLSGVIGILELHTLLLMKKSFELHENKFAEQALQIAERSRTRVMMENLVLSEANFAADADPETVEEEKAIRITLNTKSDKLTELIGASGTSEEIKNLEIEINDLENQLEEIKAELKQSSPIYSAIKNPEPFNVEEFQRDILGEDDLLLEFSLGKEESYLWAVDKRDVTAYYLPPRDAIEARVDKLRGLLGGRQLKQGDSLEDYQRRIADAEVEYNKEARALSNDLLGQAADKLAGKKLIIVADGRLHYFPLGSLPMPGSDDDAPILLTNQVVYAPSASTLKILRMKKNNETRPQKDLLVFADPVFSKSDERIVGLDTGGSGFVSMILPMFRSIESLESMPRLPASEAEAKSISKVVGANQTTVRAGFAASRDGVLNGGIEGYKILHFATHGLIDEKRPELSGILLSLYNDDGKQNDGGFIRLQDVYGLRLNSDLVVLSACDTGIGKEIKGEGVMSLNNAFLQAGAKSVVSSLWKVDDSATKDLMTEFYRGMADDNLTAAAALRQAQIKMHNDPRYHSPFYWAAFTASGDTSVKVAFTSYAWLYALIATAAIATVILALVGVRRLSRRKLGE